MVLQTLNATINASGYCRIESLLYFSLLSRSGLSYSQPYYPLSTSPPLLKDFADSKRLVIITNVFEDAALCLA
jgi:hypothetical protein